MLQVYTFTEEGESESVCARARASGAPGLHVYGRERVCVGVCVHLRCSRFTCSQERESVCVCMCQVYIFTEECVCVCMCVGKPWAQVQVVCLAAVLPASWHSEGCWAPGSQSSGPGSLCGLIGMQVSLVSQERQRVLVPRGWVLCRVQTWHLFLPQIAQPLRELPGRVHVPHLLWTHV